MAPSHTVVVMTTQDKLLPVLRTTRDTEALTKCWLRRMNRYRRSHLAGRRSISAPLAELVTLLKKLRDFVLLSHKVPSQTCWLMCHSKE